MAKGLRSKVKKRLRTVKRGVVKRELADPASKLGVRNTAIQHKLEEALSGYLKPEVRARNAFRYDDADAVVPQHNWRQGPDFRSDRVEDAGYACVGSNRPKFPHGRDGPTARVDDAPAPEGAEGDDAPMPAPPVPDDPAVRRLRVGIDSVGTSVAPQAMGNSSSQIQADLDAAQKQLAAVSKQRSELQSENAAAAATIAEQKEQLSATVAACEAKLAEQTEALAAAVKKRQVAEDMRRSDALLLSLIHISEPTRQAESRMPSSA